MYSASFAFFVTMDIVTELFPTTNDTCCLCPTGMVFGTGLKNTEAISRQFAGTDIQVFIIDPEKMAPHKDPDEYIVAHGVDAFRVLMANAESSARWMTGQILRRHELAKDIGKMTAIDDVRWFADALQNPIEAEECLTHLRSKISLSPEVLQDRYEQIRQKSAEESFRQDVESLGSELRKLAREDAPVQAIETVLENTPAQIQEYRRTVGDNPIGLLEFLDQKQTTDATRIPGQLLGYRLSQFPQIEDAMCGVQPAMVTLAADPNIGKTILMVILAIDLIASNPNLGVLFYTMDDGRDAIVSRMLAKLSGLAINDVQRKVQGSAEEKLIADAYAWLRDMVSAGRLEIQEQSESTTMGLITQSIRTHHNRGNLVCLIDGIYNVPVEGSFSSIREENIQRANALKDIVKLHRVPCPSVNPLRSAHCGEEERFNRNWV